LKKANASTPGGNDHIMDALATLYTYDKQYDKTLEILLQLKRGNAFELIRQHNLYDAVHDKVVLLMDFDREKAVEMLVMNADKIPISQVILFAY
jgi:vacuolar protein sorting-associated protein 41